MNWVNVGLWIVQSLLAILFLMAGVMKAFQYERVKASMPWARDVSKGLVLFIGYSELLGALGLTLPAITGIQPWLTPLAALGLAVTMILAAGLHARRTEYQAIVFNLILLVMAGFVAYGRWLVRPL